MMPASSTAMPDRFLALAIDSWAAAATGTMEYWSGALQRRATPWDVVSDAVRLWELTTDRRAPRWASPQEIVWQSSRSRLRDFSDGSRAAVVPTLVIPPQAGHDSCIVDYSSQQSQIQVIRAAGLDRAYAIDWKSATSETADATIVDELGEIAAAIDQIGEPVNLIGDCQGGWLATIYAALHPEDVNTLTIAGAPIDFHAGDAVIHDSVQALDADRSMSFFRSLVASGGGVLKGEYLVGGFIAIKPDNEIAKNLQLLGHLREDEHVERYRAFEDWFKHTQDIPGVFYLWLVEHLFRDNELIRGELKVGGRRVDLGAIACPVNLLAGANDHITPPAQVFALADAVTTPRAQITRRTTRGGHLGLFMGTEALREHWPPLLAGVVEHSRANASASVSARRARARTKPKRPIPAP